MCQARKNEELGFTGDRLNVEKEFSEEMIEIGVIRLETGKKKKKKVSAKVTCRLLSKRRQVGQEKVEIER